MLKEKLKMMNGVLENGNYQLGQFQFVCLSSGSFQMDRAAFAYIIPPITMRLLWLPFITSSMLI